MDRLMRHLIVRRHGDDVLGRVACDLRYAIDDELRHIWEDGGQHRKRDPILQHRMQNSVENEVCEHCVARTALVAFGVLHRLLGPHQKKHLLQHAVE